MKTLIFVITLLLFSSNIFTQWVFKQTGAGNNTQPLNTQFLNPSTGYVLYKSQDNIGSPVYWRVMKTTNKGSNWLKVSEVYREDPNSYADISFVDVNTGILFVKASYPGLTTFYTSNGGNNWNNNYFYLDGMAYPQIKFIDLSTGYLFSRGSGVLYKTTNTGYTWDPKYTFTQGGIWDLAISPNNSDRIYLGGHKNGTGQFYNSPPYLVKSEDGFNTHTEIFNGTVMPDYMNSILKIIILNNNGSDDIKLSCYKGLKKLVNSNGDLQSIYNFPYEKSGWQNFKIQFSDDKIGFAYWQYEQHNNTILKTTDGGYSWFTDLSNWNNPYNSDLKDFNTFGDMCFLPDWFGIMMQKRLTINFNTMFDWQSGSGSIEMNNFDNAGTRYITTPLSNQFLAGGTANISVPETQIFRNDSALMFYYWGGKNGNGSLNPIDNQFYYDLDGSINADYKSKLKTTNSGSLLNANQVKVLKDTNGVTNLVYESMGGIFYTRTKPDGNFKAEEIVSGSMGSSKFGHVTYENSNPYICEINGNPNEYNKEKNISVCFERREGNNVKIFVARRWLQVNKPEWALTDSILIQNVPSGFKCFPKLVMSSYVDNVSYYHKLVTYLKPINGSSSNVKLCATFISNLVGGQPERDLVPASNLQEYAISGLLSNPGSSSFILHFAYRDGQTVYYKKVQAGYDMAGFNVVTLDPATNISSDASGWRASLDIALKNTANSSSSFNMQPVVTYQGRKNVRIIIDNEDGPPSELITNNYPIYVKERLPSGEWSSVIVSYNNPNINEPQMNPTIVGSKHRNSCVVSYGRGNSAPYTFMQKVHMWNGSISSGYNCNPISYTANDVKIVKGGLIDDGPASLSQKMMTLSYQAANLFNVGTQSLNISNGIEGDGNFEEISGLIEANNVQYTFNLGNILVNSQNINFANNLDTVIDNIGELNNNLASKPFLLNENDTLIIGRNAAYVLNDPNGAPVEIEYWVRLMNKTKNSEHRLLVHDTLRAVDSVLYEYLEGYIIRNIEGGTDSFYVQLEIDTVDGNFGIGGGLGGDGDGGGDAPNTIKKKIFWENENLTIKGNTLPTEFALYQNFPNPFNPATVITYDLPKDVKVTVKIYDLLGREVVALVNNEFKNAGRYELNWNAGKYASGVYIYRIEAGNYIKTRKMILIK